MLGLGIFPECLINNARTLFSSVDLLNCTIKLFSGTLYYWFLKVLFHHRLHHPRRRHRRHQYH